jgi:hypothetical protein
MSVGKTPFSGGIQAPRIDMLSVDGISMRAESEGALEIVMEELTRSRNQNRVAKSFLLDPATLMLKRAKAKFNFWNASPGT